MFDKLSDETERLLYCHTSNKCDDMWIIAFGDFFHHVNFLEEVTSFTSSSTRCSGWFIMTLGTHPEWLHTCTIYSEKGVSTSHVTFTDYHIRSHIHTHAHTQNLRLSNLIAALIYIVLFMAGKFGMGPMTLPLWTSPKHPSLNFISIITLLTGISHSSVFGADIVKLRGT